MAMQHRNWLYQLRQRFIDQVDVQAVEQRFLHEGRLSASYLFLLTCSCAIATLGLMANSAPVVIGAMLVAPLMGPIALLGFAIARTEFRFAFVSFRALSAGIAGGLLISALIVKLSPPIPPTSEILARIQPTLFDLLVAVFSGMVGGFALIRQQVGTIAGVAIASSLMPPLAAAGYGIATWDWPIFSGAFFLFLTNLLAIALSVAGMVSWYGLARLHSPGHLAGKTIFAFMVLVLLSVPLIHSLDRTVRQLWLASRVEQVIRTSAGNLPLRFGGLDVKAHTPGPAEISAMVFTPRFVPDLVSTVTTALQQQHSLHARVHIDQVVLASNTPLAGAPLSGLPEAPDLQVWLRRLAPGPLPVLEVDSEQRLVRMQAGATWPGGLESLRYWEQALHTTLPGWRFTLRPASLPPLQVLFAPGSAHLDAAAEQTLETAAWAFARSSVSIITLAGSASARERQPQVLARNRVRAVAERLQALGLEVRDAPSRDAPGSVSEAEAGAATFRRVVIMPWAPGEGA